MRFFHFIFFFSPPLVSKHHVSLFIPSVLCFQGVLSLLQRVSLLSKVAHEFALSLKNFGLKVQ